MPSAVFTGATDDAQGVIDPLIAQARVINIAAEIDRNLAIRKALRPMRSDAAKRGWERRS